MDESILTTIKRLLGIAPDYAPFDPELVIHINSYLGVLNQLGVGLSDFRITGGSETWSDFLGDTTALKLHEIEEYIFLRVKMVFDPPTSSIVSSAIDKNIDELGWRIREAVEHEAATKE